MTSREPGPAPGDPISAKVFAEEVDLVFRAYPQGILGTYLLVLPLVCVLWNHVARGALLVWVAAMASFGLARFHGARAYLRARPAPEQIPPWARRLRWTALYLGTCWGVGLFLLPPGIRDFPGMFYVLCLFGAGSGAIHSFAVLPGLYRAFFLPLFLSLMAWALLPLDGNAWASAALLFLAGLWNDGFARRSQAMTEHSLRLNFENRALVEELGVSNDDLRETAADLQEARERAEAAAQVKSSFLANMSHEIRTPMNAILGFSQLGLKLPLEARPRDYFQKIATASKSLLGIINDILDFSKIEAGRLELEAVPFSLASVVGNVADLFAQGASEKGLELVLDLEPGLPQRLIGDPLRLTQVLNNLLSNALKFTAAGQVLLRVTRGSAENGATATDRADQARLQFSIEDSGIGLTADQAERLFIAFSQADTSTTRKFGGTGLGLVISQRLVALMGGRIQVASAPGLGSTFSFSAGFGQEACPDPPPLPQALHALVVDDHPAAGRVLEAQLRHLGCTVAVVEAGEAALASLRETRFDVVLVDWQMPGLDGLGTIRRLRALPGLQSLPTILMLPAGARESLWPAALDAGIRSCLQKPVHPELLRQALAEAMGWDEGRPPSPLPVASDTRETLAGLRVLMVEDNPINQEVAREILRHWGADPRIASSGPEALRLLETEVFDVVLMDVQMPEMDGYETTGRIRRMPAHLDLPILAMTANAMEQDRLACLEAGMNDFVPKPIDPDELLAALIRWGRPEAEANRPPPPPASPAETAPELWDLPGTLRTLGGDEALLANLLEIFREDHGGDGERLRVALEQGDFGLAERLTHTLKGVAGTMGAKQLQGAAERLEAALRTGAREVVPELLERVRESLHASLLHLGEA